MSRTLHIDIETFSPIDLGTAGVYRYAEDPDFSILLFGYAWDDEEVQVVALAGGQRLPHDVGRAILDPGVKKVAWNANFERVCLSRFMGAPMPPEEWDDPMIKAAELGLPRSLADAGWVLGLPEDEQKKKEGRNLIQFFSKPCRPTKSNGGRTRNLPEHDPARWARYIEYNAQDVRTERRIAALLDEYHIQEAEHGLWCIDQDINDRGVMIDRRFVENAVQIDEQTRAKLKEEAARLSGLENPNSVAQIKRWIQERTGVTVTSLDRRVIGDVLEQVGGYETVSRFLQIRKALAKTSTAKYARALECANSDDRVRGLSQFYGASRTGRWAGRNLQLQNLARNAMPDEDLDLARRLVKEGDAEGLSLLYEPTQALSELIRTALVPSPGYKFIVSDFSAIEARVLAWLAGETWRLDVFKGDGKIYEASAEKMFNLPPGSVKKHDPMRQKGKIAELALGYGGSVGALKAMGALEMGLTEEELKPLVTSWRAANRHITAFWWDIDKLVRQVIRGPRNGNRWRLAGDASINVRMDIDLLRIKLPSGREISYYHPRIEDDAITYEGQIQAGGWGKIETYGPKLVENIVQALSRDCLAESMRRLAEKKIPVVFHVHDEVICEVPEDGHTADEIAEIMGKPIRWAPGLPMKADAYECNYYRKD